MNVFVSYGVIVVLAAQLTTSHAALQFAAAGSNRVALSPEIDDSGTCTDLLNKGTHFAVKVSVGTPAQDFELVADTGSDSVIVTSCVCTAEMGGCQQQDKCFKGTNHSSTFKVTEFDQLPGGKVKASAAAPKGPMGVSMTFGSGTVTCVVAGDTVQVGDVKANMKDGLLLLVDRRALAISGQFEGILGLGPKKSDAEQGAADKSPKKKPDLPLAQRSTSIKPPKGVAYAPKLFLEQANVDRFSICFNDKDKPGSLRLNVPEFKNPLPSIGTFHWGLAMHGMSVGSGAAHASSSSGTALFCQESEMNQTNGQKTPCGAIPDSGTTLMMGPKAQVEKLFEGICDGWDRCKEARQGIYKNQTKSHAFQLLLANCSSWLDKEKGVNELPSVFVKLGAKDNLQDVEITPWAYVMETMQEKVMHVTGKLAGVLPVVLDLPTGKKEKVCVPSFGVQEYNTAVN
jgi:hypothetical protein